jgi:hypothetical protein
MQRPSLRTLAVVAAGLAFGATAAVRIAPITPSLDIQLIRLGQERPARRFMILCKARGAEPAEELSVEVVSGPVRLVGNTSMKSLPALWRVSFEAEVERPGDKGIVRVVQKGSAPKSYDVELIGDGP